MGKDMDSKIPGSGMMENPMQENMGNEMDTGVKGIQRDTCCRVAAKLVQEFTMENQVERRMDN